MARPRKNHSRPEKSGERSLCIGRHLQNIRKNRGLTQKKLAEKCGLTREAIAAYESGRIHLADITIIDLAAALRVSADEILGIKETVLSETPASRGLMQRMLIIKGLPSQIRKRILGTLDDSIRANTRLSILDD
jgi:transcriptional regulator with XRE-family HTH domain